MSNCGCSRDKKIEAVDISSVPIDTMTSLPQFILTERDVEDELSGDVVRALTRTPVGRLFPVGSTDNVYAIPANNDSLDFSNWHVAPGYIKNFGSYYGVQFADGENEAMFVMVGCVDEASGRQVLFQNTGVINVPEGHDFVLLAQYYTNADGSGVPTTDSTTGQKLFIPISRMQLLVNLGQ